MVMMAMKNDVPDFGTAARAAWDTIAEGMGLSAYALTNDMPLGDAEQRRKINQAIRDNFGMVQIDTDIQTIGEAVRHVVDLVGGVMTAMQIVAKHPEITKDVPPSLTLP